MHRALTEGYRLPPRPVVLTFDDGYADAYEHAFHLLDRFGMVGTFFVVTDWLDQSRPGYLTWDQARTMARGHVDPEPQPQPSRSGERLRLRLPGGQILGSAGTIAAQIGVRPRFCHPSGRYNADVLTVVSQVGMVAAVTIHGGTLHTSDRPLGCGVRMRGTTTLDDFAWMMADWRE